jgi:hypothetical protein
MKHISRSQITWKTLNGLQTVKHLRVNQRNVSLLEIIDKISFLNLRWNLPQVKDSIINKIQTHWTTLMPMIKSDNIRVDKIEAEVEVKKSKSIERKK